MFVIQEGEVEVVQESSEKSYEGGPSEIILAELVPGRAPPEKSVVAVGVS